MAMCDGNPQYTYFNVVKSSSAFYNMPSKPLMKTVNLSVTKWKLNDISWQVGNQITYVNIMLCPIATVYNASVPSTTLQLNNEQTR